MTKQKKKRTKRYTGVEAAQGPIVHRYEAVERSRLGEWWFENKAKLRIIGVILLVLVIVAFIVSGIITLVR